MNLDDSIKMNLETNNFYKNEDRRNEPKEYFKMVYKNIIEDFNLCKIDNIVDIGCATGDFLYFLSENLKETFPKVSLWGVDSFKELLNIAKQRLPNCNFIEGNILLDLHINDLILNLNNKKEINIICMMGVINLFNEFEIWINNILKLINDKGVCYIFGVFNSYSYDLSLNFESMNGKKGTYYINSIEKISKYLDSIKIKYEFLPFKLNINILPNSNNYLRSWTIPLKNGENGVINGLQLWHEFYLLKLKKY